MADLIRLTVNIDRKTADSLEKLAELKQVNKNEALSRAIAVDLYIEEQMVDGGRLLLRKPDGEIVEILLVGIFS